ncbi:hypothetical protein LguiA_008001 [Lonicera macranthoides]
MSRPINKEWMNERNRLSQVYRQGVEEFIEYAIANDVLKLPTILCPCVKCRNKLRYPAVDIRKHLIKNGINKTYTQWLLHGEDPSFISMDHHPPLGHVELEEDIEPIDNNGDEGIGIENLVDAAYGVYDETFGDAPCGQTEVKEAKLKRKSGEASSNTTENDELSEVFGKDQRGHVRGVGSHVTKKQLIHLGIAKAKEEANKVEKEGINALKDEFKSYVQEAVKVQFQDFQLAIQGAMQNMMADFNRGSLHVMTTPRSEFASNSVHRSCNLVQNLDNVFTPSPVERPNSSDKPSVILIDRENKELAKGYVVTDATAGICHGRKVGIGEKKVYIDEVLEPDAPLWFPQDGNDTFSAYVAGGYIIWFEPWLKYI